MTDSELQKWSDEQVKVLISCGVDPLDAQNTAKRVLAQLPEGADPRTWIPPVPGGNVVITAEDIADARADWYASDTVPPKFTMLLDATETSEDA